MHEVIQGVKLVKTHPSSTCDFQEHLECCHPTSRWDWGRDEGSCERFIYRPGLEVAHIISTHNLLARPQTHAKT